MPRGGPYLPQATIDAIAQWIIDGATMSPEMMSQAMAQRSEQALFEVVAIAPADTAVATAPVRGTGGGAIESVSGAPLDSDYDFVFTVGTPR